MVAHEDVLTDRVDLGREQRVARPGAEYRDGLELPTIFCGEEQASLKGSTVRFLFDVVCRRDPGLQVPTPISNGQCASDVRIDLPDVADVLPKRPHVLGGQLDRFDVHPRMNPNLVATQLTDGDRPIARSPAQHSHQRCQRR